MPNFLWHFAEMFYLCRDIRYVFVKIGSCKRSIKMFNTGSIRSCGSIDILCYIQIKGITVFKNLIWGDISLYICSEVMFYSSAPNIR